MLLNRFKNAKLTWENFLTDAIKAKLIPTRILSGEELIDNIEYRNRLIAENPDSKGGEMEGVGVYAACDGKADWIVVKGICDFADGEKQVDKNRRQLIAVNSALSICLEVFNSSSAFKQLKILPREKAPKHPSFTKMNDALFDIYDTTKEKYYIQRPIDLEFTTKVKQIGLWIHGPSGCGKSNLIIRNLKKTKKNFIQINLASCIGMDVEAFFTEILYEIASKIDGVNFQTQPKSFSDCVKAIIQLLEKKYENKELILFIEEIPISTEASYKEFTGKIFSLLISKNLSSGLNRVKVVLSSINNPISHIEPFQQKIHHQINFIAVDNWPKSEIKQLIELIEGALSFSLSISIRDELITFAKGSPRFVKKFFRNIITIEKFDQESLKFILIETQKELSGY